MKCEAVRRQRTSTSRGGSAPAAAAAATMKRSSICEIGVLAGMVWHMQSRTAGVPPAQARER